MVLNGFQSLYIFAMQAVGLLFFVFAGIALKTGEVHTRENTVYRAENPTVFYLFIGFLIGLGLLTLFLASMLASPHTVFIPVK